MKIEKQVCSLELANRLSVLGVPQLGAFVWRERKYNEKMPRVSLFDSYDDGMYSVEGWEIVASAFTVAELGELLPTEQNDRLGFFSGRAINGWFCEVKNYGVMPFERLHVELQHDTEANARAAMLIYLIENNHIKV